MNLNLKEPVKPESLSAAEEAGWAKFNEEKMRLSKGKTPKDIFQGYVDRAITHIRSGSAPVRHAEILLPENAGVDYMDNLQAIESFSRENSPAGLARILDSYTEICKRKFLSTHDSAYRLVGAFIRGYAEKMAEIEPTVGAYIITAIPPKTLP